MSEPLAFFPPPISLPTSPHHVNMRPGMYASTGARIVRVSHGICKPSRLLKACPAKIKLSTTSRADGDAVGGRSTEDIRGCCSDAAASNTSTFLVERVSFPSGLATPRDVGLAADGIANQPRPRLRVTAPAGAAPIVGVIGWVQPLLASQRIQNVDDAIKLGLALQRQVSDRLLLRGQTRVPGSE